MIFFIFFISSLFLNLFADEKEGDLLFQATLFEKAIEFYRLDNNPLLRVKIVESLYHLGKMEEVIFELENREPKNEELFFLALAYESTDQEFKALHAKENYINSPSADPARAKRFIENLGLKKVQYYIDTKNWEEANNACQNSVQTPEILFARIKILEELKKPEAEIKQARLNFLSSAPLSVYLGEVSFELYDFQDYLLGKKEAIKHLKNFVKEFKNSPQSIIAWYLIGMDFKRNRKTSEGRWIHHKNLDEAIDAFKHSDTLFQNLKPFLNEKEAAYYQTLNQKTTLESALAFIEIAATSSDSKREVYLKYAHNLLSFVDGIDHKLLLVEVMLKEKLNEEAYSELERLEKLLPLHEKLYLSKVFSKKGELLYKFHKPDIAFEYFEKAEKIAPPDSFSVDETLSLLIYKSLCENSLKNYDKSMLLLSEVVNSGFISSLRIKAMYLRALIYETQGKKELARRQFETALIKGGQWAEKEKDKWIKDYHNQHE